MGVSAGLDLRGVRAGSGDSEMARTARGAHGRGRRSKRELVEGQSQARRVVGAGHGSHRREAQLMDSMRGADPSDIARHPDVPGPMAHRQRLEATLAGRPVDRPPVSFWHHFPGRDHTPELLADATVAFYRRFDVDLVKLMP